MQTEWILENRVALVSYDGELSIDDVRQTVAEMLPQLDQGEAPIHSIVNMVNVTGLGFSVNDLLTLPESSAYYLHPALGWTLYAGNKNNQFYQFVTSAIAQNYDAKMRWFDSEADAITFLRSLDERLS